ncbi:oligopeptide/dipeptide ABC transporter ATP-binding protein [Dethiobacter alkaliphilus]|uniref:oligopeptide/dipeptide ABC transporter ATP-binding protein n=1 Tax=Dethiobacter alkaliphilus TaxID=427926 RepID=UPI0022271979|nr:ABC transporter ATP-binding protein [Dethiobacter alkaliphilus]MCW3490873.1 ABC transporter ATP-binding protein [Dethiobacter alkaliphilus]
MSEYIIEGKNLFAGYPAGHKWVKAVEGVSLNVQSGEAVALVGESGSGKTTLGKVLAGLLPHRQGRLYIGQKPATGRPVGEIQMVFQDSSAALNPRLTVSKLVEEGLVIHGERNKKERLQAVMDALTAVGLTAEYFNRFPHQMSGGERQRVALARALIMQPKMVVLDEPVSALDVTTGAQLLQMIGDLQKKYGLAYVMISHNLAVVRHVCSRVMVMYMGKIVEKGPVADVFAKPGHYYTEMLLEAHPLPDPRLRKDFAGYGDPPDSVKPPSGCRFHPRCRAAVAKCKRIPPGFAEISPGHLAACHLAG